VEEDHVGRSRPIACRHELCRQHRSIRILVEPCRARS
jgi:hypothetical protein